MMRSTWGVYVLAAVTIAVPASAQETVVTVRVVASDAKIVGSGVGGARVVIRNAATGGVLAEGVQQGSTGSTERIMILPRSRGLPVFDIEGAGRYVARVAIDTPTVVEIAAEGPIGYPQAMQRASTTMLLVPGAEVTGDGIVLELHGFIVELLAPQAPRRGGTVEVRAAVRMMCGCPHTPGGLWDADRLRVTAVLYDGTRMLGKARMTYAGEPNIFAGSISLADAPAGATLVVIAADGERGNFGRSEVLEVR